MSTAPYLTVWLNHHPFPNNPESPLWVHFRFVDNARHLKYQTIRDLLRRHFNRAGINKPYNPHIFRHSRATYVLANGIMNEAQAKAYFGWTPGSKMLSAYAHLVDHDANNALLKEPRLHPTTTTAREASPIKCSCGELNTTTSTYCAHCGTPLHPSTPVPTPIPVTPSPHVVRPTMLEESDAVLALVVRWQAAGSSMKPPKPCTTPD